MTTDAITTEAQAIATLATAAAQPLTKDIEGATILAGAYPMGWHLAVEDLERFGARPRRKTGSPLFTETASLASYIELQLVGDPAKQDRAVLPTIYAQPDAFACQAVFDDHTADGPGWRQHVARLQLRPTDEWKAWAGIDKQFLSATDLAEFIEEWRHTIADPPTGDILDMVRSFRATKTVTFRDEIVDRSGDRALEYVTETTAQAGAKGQLEIPEGFGLVLAPFDGATPRPVPARFRYRLTEGRAAFGVVLEQPAQVAKAAFADELDRLTGHGTILIGTHAAR